VLTWLSKRSIAEIGCIALALFAGLQTIRVAAEQRHAHKVEAQLSKCTAAREADRRAYAKAQADAAAKNKAHVAEVEAQQKRITDETVASLNDRLSRLAGELRAHGPAAQSHPNGAGSPALPKPASGTSEAPGLCLSPEQLLRAAQDEERHDQIIQWIEQQMTIDPNKP
jgi:acyl-coenzyme A synthetase/AMP-(fatty) acid ligase